MSGGTAMTTMTIEPVSAFSSLDVLVAMDEGLFRAEGLDLRMASRESRDIRSTTEGTLSSPVTNQGRLAERGDATVFQGGECGNNRRVAESRVGALQHGPRARIACA